MKFGLCLPIRRNCTLEFNINLAVRAEKLGFDSVWASDHVIMPSSVKKNFSSIFYDPFVLLTAIAAKTREIKIGTSVIILPYRHPIVVAKMISTLDVLSEGRIIFGVASGWLKEEFHALNVDFNKRGKITNEYLQAILELWKSDSPNFSGDFVNFSDIDFFPKPYNNRLPEIWVGGASKYAVERSLKFATGWQPTWVSPNDFAELKESLISTARDMKVDLRDFTLCVRNRIKITKSIKAKGSRVYMFSGNIDDILREVEAFKTAGVDYIVFDPETNSNSETIKMIEELSESIIKKYK